MAQRIDRQEKDIADLLKANGIDSISSPDDIRRVVASAIGQYVNRYGPVLSYQVEHALASFSNISSVTDTPINQYLLPSKNTYLHNRDYSFTSLAHDIELATKDERKDHACEVNYKPNPGKESINRNRQTIAIHNTTVFYKDIAQLKDFILARIQGPEKIMRYKFIVP